MSEQQERFLEKTLAQMRLDGDQTEAAGRELRVMVEEAMADGVARGLTPEQAEEEALRELALLMGPPPRLFETANGRGWLLFERLAMVFAFLMLYLFALIFFAPLILGSEKPRVAIIGLGIISLDFSFGVLQGLWNPVWIQGGLAIRRWLRPTMTIPFEAIREVSIAINYLFSTNHLIIKHDGGSLKIKIGWRQIACPCLFRLLGALRPEALHPKVKKKIQGHRFSTRRESPWFKGIFSVLWFAALVLLARALPPTWGVQGISPWLIAAWAMAWGTAWTQGLYDTEPARGGLCWLTMSGVLMTGCIFEDMLVGSGTFVRPLLTLLLALTVFSLLALWWRGSRRGLTGAFAALVLAAAGAAPLLPPLHTVPVRTLAQWPSTVECATWLNAPKPTWFATGLRQGSNLPMNGNQILWASAKGSGKSPLDGGGTWTMLPNYDARTMTLVQMENGEKVKDEPYRRTKIWLYNPESGLRLLDSGRMPAYWAQRSDFFWSPDRTRYVLPQAPETSSSTEMRSALKVVNMKNKSVRLFPGLGSILIWWTGPETLRLFIGRSNETTDDGPKQPKTFEFWNLNLRTGEKTLAASFKGKSPYYECHRFAKTRDFLFFFDEHNQISDRYDLKTGAMKTFTGVIQGLVTDRAGVRHAYVVMEPDNRQRLVVADGTRTILDRKLENGEILGRLFSLSPDGARLFYAYRDNRGIVGDGTLTYRMLDVTSGGEKIVDTFGLFPALEANLLEIRSITMPPVEWTPDSRAVVYPVSGYRQRWWRGKGKVALRQATLE